MAIGNGKKKNKRLYIIIAVVVLVIVVAGVSIAAKVGGTKIYPAKLGKVEQGDLAKSVVATGKIEPITKVDIKSKASGMGKRRAGVAGDRGKTGQVMAELDKEEIQARVRAAQASLAAAEANWNATQA